MCSQTCPRHAAGTQATHNLTTDLTADQAMSSVRSERVHRLGYPKNVISSFWKLEGSQCLKSDARAHTCACTCARTRAHTHTHTHTHTHPKHTPKTASWMVMMVCGNMLAAATLLQKSDSSRERTAQARNSGKMALLTQGATLENFSDAGEHSGRVQHWRISAMQVSTQAGCNTGENFSDAGEHSGSSEEFVCARPPQRLMQHALWANSSGNAAHTHLHIHAHAPAQTQTCTYTHVKHTHLHMHAHAQKTHAPAHACTRTCTNTHKTYAPAHTHTCGAGRLRALGLGHHGVPCRATFTAVEQRKRIAQHARLLL